MVKKNFEKKIWLQKPQKRVLGQTGEKMAKSKNFGRIFFGRNRFRIFQNVYYTKISKSKIFSHANFFLELSRFFHLCGQFFENLKNVETLPSSLKRFPLQIGFKIYKNDPRPILYNFDFFVPTLQIFPLYHFS